MKVEVIGVVYIFEVGDIVCALAGRDKEKRFVVVGILDENYVFIADGKSRKIDSPKKKKIKHIEISSKAANLENLKDGRFTNSILRKIIDEYSEYSKYSNRT